MMSSETSTRNARARKASGSPAKAAGPGERRASSQPAAAGRDGRSNAIRPWHLFVLGGLGAASAGALTVYGSRPENVIFVALAVLTAATAGFAMYRTLWPLVAEEGPAGPEMLGGRTRAALEREKFLVLRSIKELEFDRAMGKVSEGDFDEMTAQLRTRAVRLIKQLDAGSAGYRELIEREVQARLGRGRALAGGAVRTPAAVAEVAESVAVVVDAVTVSADAEDRPACPSCRTLNEPDARFCKSCGVRLS
jgi:hypothetical protein